MKTHFQVGVIDVNYGPVFKEEMEKKNTNSRASAPQSLPKLLFTLFYVKLVKGIEIEILLSLKTASFLSFPC